MNGTGSRQERLINYRLYAGADIHIEKSGVPSVRIYPVTEKYVDDIVVGVDPKCRAGVAGVSVNRLGSFFAGRTFCRRVGIGFVKTEATAAQTAFVGCKTQNRRRFEIIFEPVCPVVL